MPGVDPCLHGGSGFAIVGIGDCAIYRVGNGEQTPIEMGAAVYPTPFSCRRGDR
jgi:hypothetical protein